MSSVDLTALLGGQPSTPKINTLIDSAKFYASKGMMVFPCHDVSSGRCSCGDIGCRSAGKHPRVNGWIDQATNNIEMITTWWELWPNANIGIATGPQSGVWVLDVDVKDNGMEEFTRIVRENGPFQDTPFQKTGSGGLHYFFTYDERVKSRGRCLPGIDVRSDGGLIIVSPSINGNGAYEWINDLNTPIAKSPEWLIELVERKVEKIEHNNHSIEFVTDDSDIDEALLFIDSYDRDTWLHVAMGLKSHGIGQHVWDNWSKSCTDKYNQKTQNSTWKSLKRDDIKIGTVFDLAKKGGYIPKPNFVEEDYSHVDLSVILQSLGGKKEISVEDKSEVNDLFSRAPGVIGEIARFHEETAPKSQPELAVACAISLASAICGRKFITGEGNLSSLFVLGVAKSTAGKEHGAKTIEAILEASDKMHLNGGSWFTSDSACYQSLLKHPRQIVVSDELGITVQTVGSDKSGMQLKLRSFLMQIITKLDSAVPPLKYSERGLSEEQKKEGAAVLKCPALSLYGTTTSSTFFESMNMAMVHDGFLGRLLVVESTQPRTKMRRNRRSSSDVPHSIKTWVKEVEAKGGNLSMVEDGQTRPNSTVLNFTDSSYDLFDKYEDEIIDLQNKLEEEGLEPLVGRAVEYSMRVALIAQLAINPSSTAISKEATEWAIEFVDHCFKTTLTRVRNDVKASKHERLMNDVLESIKALCSKLGSTNMTELSRKTRRFTSGERNQIVQSLVETGEIIIEQVASESGGRPRQVIKVKNN